jgi:hypothetical protein
MKKLNICFSVIILCCLSIIGKGETIRGNKYLLSYTAHKGYIPILLNESKVIATDYITVPYSISSSALYTTGWTGVIEVSNENNFCDSPDDRLSANLSPQLYVPGSDFLVEGYGFGPNAQGIAYTDIDVYYITCSSGYGGVIVSATSSMSIYFY